MVVAEVCSTMKYPKRSQYKHVKQKRYHVRNDRNREVSDLRRAVQQRQPLLME